MRYKQGFGGDRRFTDYITKKVRLKLLMVEVKEYKKYIKSALFLTLSDRSQALVVNLNLRISHRKSATQRCFSEAWLLSVDLLSHMV